jgi:flavin reductase (DIM6/NTAB) family NADH-FMN oxidoreductase RutF
MGIPVLSDSLANIECDLGSTFKEEDHAITVGSVDTVTLGKDGSPTLYYKSTYAIHF